MACTGDSWLDELQYALDNGMVINLGAVVRTCAHSKLMQFQVLLFFIDARRPKELCILLEQWGCPQFSVTLLTDRALRVAVEHRDEGEAVEALRMLLARGAPVSAECLEAALRSGDAKMIAMFLDAEGRRQGTFLEKVVKFWENMSFW